MLLALMPYMVQAQVTDINSRDLRGKVVYQDDEVVFRQLDWTKLWQRSLPSLSP